MTGLRTLDIFMAFPMEIPLADDLSLFENTWVDALFDLQRNLKTVRDFSMDTEYGEGSNTAGNREAQRVRKFEKMIQNRLSELRHTVVVSREKIEV